jgi:hypothetical protein
MRPRLARPLCFSLLSLLSCQDVQPAVVLPIAVTPPKVVFRGPLPRADPYRAEVVVRNLEPTRFAATVALLGDSRFSLPQQESELVVEPGWPRWLVVNYHAVDVQPHRAELRIGDLVRVPISTTHRGPILLVESCVRYDSAGPCLRGSGENVSLGYTRPGQCSTAEIHLRNGGDESLLVASVVLESELGTGLRLEGTPPTELTLAPITLEGHADEAVLKFLYCPEPCSEGAHSVLRIRSDDPVRREATVNVVAGALDLQPPACSCDPARREVAVLETIELSANCFDPWGCFQYLWTLVQRPEGSLSAIQDPHSRNARFLIDVSTPADSPYVFRLTAIDRRGGMSSCEVTVFARPPDALQIELLWAQDVTDLDLHLLNPPGSTDRWGPAGWFNQSNDCYYLNRSPDWGGAQETRDNPRLDVDDVTGFGPEHISFPSPAAGTYSIGVHYFCDDGMGPSDATVRVFCQGAAPATFGPRRLLRSGAFWEVATLAWPGCGLTPIDEIRFVPQGCQSPPDAGPSRGSSLFP